jgi:hypothetical protein
MAHPAIDNVLSASMLPAPSGFSSQGLSSRRRIERKDDPMRLLIALIVTLGFNIPFPVAAQTPRPVSGTILSFDGSTLVMKPSTGDEVTIRVPPEVKVGAVAERKLEDIKPGDFVGSAAVRGPDGKLHAQEVHIFPDAMRGTGEGHRPMSEPNQTMTNATVAQIVTANTGRVLQLRYGNSEQAIVVDAGTRIVALIPGDRSLLKPGASVLVFVRKEADGSMTARAIQAEKNGVKPII